MVRTHARSLDPPASERTRDDCIPKPPGPAPAGSVAEAKARLSALADQQPWSAVLGPLAFNAAISLASALLARRKEPAGRTRARRPHARCDSEREDAILRCEQACRDILATLCEARDQERAARD